MVAQWQKCCLPTFAVVFSFLILLQNHSNTAAQCISGFTYSRHLSIQVVNVENPLAIYVIEDELLSHFYFKIFKNDLLALAH